MLKRTAILSDTKNGDDREVPLSSVVIEVIKRQPHHITGFLFPIRGDSVTLAFSRVCKNAKIEDLRFHDLQGCSSAARSRTPGAADLRHEATSRFFEMGFETMEVSAITGHKDLAMLKRHTHLKAEDLATKLG